MGQAKQRGSFEQRKADAIQNKKPSSRRCGPLNVKPRKMGLLAAMLLALGISGGCSTVTAKKGDWEFSRSSFGTQLSIGSFKIIENAPGIITVELEGMQSDQAQAIKAAAEGAARGAVKVVAPYAVN